MQHGVLCARTDVVHVCPPARVHVPTVSFHSVVAAGVAGVAVVIVAVIAAAVRCALWWVLQEGDVPWQNGRVSQEVQPVMAHRHVAASGDAEARSHHRQSRLCVH